MKKLQVGAEKWLLPSKSFQLKPNAKLVCFNGGPLKMMKIVFVSCEEFFLCLRYLKSTHFLKSTSQQDGESLAS